MKSHHVIKKKKNTCSSLEAMSSCMEFLAWLTTCSYQPAAMDTLGFHVETSQLHKRVREREKYDLYSAANPHLSQIVKRA